MVRKNIGNWKKRFQPIISIDSWTNDEEREQFIKQLSSRRRFPRSELMDVLANSYTISDRDKRLEIIETVEELFRNSGDIDLPSDLIELFKSTSDPELRKWIIKTLPDLSNDALVPSIVEMFRHSNRVFRLAAQRLLDEFDLDIVADCLAEELTHGNWANRAEPLRYLNERAPDKVLKPCQHSLTIGNEEDRITAVEILSDIRLEASMKLLADAASDSSNRVRKAVAKAIGRIPGDTTIEILLNLAKDTKTAVIIEALEGLRRLGDETVIPIVLECVNHDNTNVKAKALETLGELGSAEHVELLISGIKNPDIHIRQSALQATINVSQKENVDIGKLISHLMADIDVNVRRAAAQILGEVNSPALFDKIFQYLQDTDWWVREMVANSLAKLNDERVFPAVVELLKHPDPSLRRYAIDILISMNQRKAVNSIIPLLKDQDWWVRERAVIALGKLGSQKINPILSNLLEIPELRYVAAEALGEIGHISAVGPLTEHLADADSESKIAIMIALEKIKAVEAIPILKEYLTTSDREVRNKAKDVLARLKVDPERLSVESSKWWEQHDFSMLDTMLMEVRHQSASELFLVTNQPAIARLNGELIEISSELLTEDQILSMCTSILTPSQEQHFNDSHSLDFTYEIKGGGRFRGNVIKHSTGINLVLKMLPDDIPSLDSLKLPGHIKHLATLKSGLTLITGPSMGGKTTTMAALIDRINETRNDNVISIEDPIEFVHTRKKCLITQRELGRHTPTFARALRAALREDPNVVYVSDLKDHETIAIALTAAETGHYVLATMNALSATNAIEKMINSFPLEQQDLIRTMLSESLQSITTQILVPTVENGSIAACEVLVNTRAVAGMIRENKLFQLPSMITSGSRHGMISLDQSLVQLVREKIISPEIALGRAHDKNQIESLLKEMGE